MSSFIKNIENIYSYIFLKGAAGKILNVTDASGTLEYEYGKLGEVTKETRTLKKYSQGNNEKVIAVMEYRSDYLGRMQYIIYPDGEKITYGYDLGGQVTTVTGVNYDQTFNYVNDIGYDEYGQRVYIEYGNGVKTNYTYDPARRWLSNIKTHNALNVQFQNIDYKFDLVGNVLSYTNNCLTGLNGNYSTTQSYSYDDLYQLIRVDGETIYNPYQSYEPEYISNYTQEFTFDTLGLGNMTTKTSTEKVSPHKTIGDDLNYNFVYNYDENYAHRLVNVGNRYYKYDSNGNIILEQEGAFEENEEVVYRKVTEEAEDVYSTDYGWGLFKEKESYSNGGTRYKRTYTWNEKNQLISSVDANYSTAYVYGQDGQRSNKYTANSETLYFNKMWTLHTDTGNAVKGGQYAKNIYLGETRIVTKLNSGFDPKYQEEYYKQYFYHSDHLGSASLISDYKGDEYQRIEYTPYGETWVEKTNNTGLEFLPYKFTAKELDEETGLYYYGARYLDPKYSLWISTDPALGEYLGQSGKGEGGIYNSANLNLYHYANNNPVKYTDPDGNWVHVVVGAAIGATIGGITTAFAGGSARQIAAAAVGGAVTGGMAAATCGASLGAQIAGSAMAGTAGYCAEKLVAGEPGTVGGMVQAAAGGATGAMLGAVVSKAVSCASAAQSSKAANSAHTNQSPAGNTDALKVGPYSDIPDPKNVGPGKPFTKAQKEAIIQENMRRNGGVVCSDGDGRVLVKPSKSVKGVTPDPNEWQIDHINPRSRGGSNSNSNAQVLSRQENRIKSDSVE